MYVHTSSVPIRVSTMHMSTRAQNIQLHMYRRKHTHSAYYMCTDTRPSNMHTIHTYPGIHAMLP